MPVYVAGAAELTKEAWKRVAYLEYWSKENIQLNWSSIKIPELSPLQEIAPIVHACAAHPSSQDIV